MTGLKRIRVAIKSKEIVLRDPKTMARITMEGKLVPKNSFWLRRLKAGDCIILKENNLTEKEVENDNSV